MPSHSGSYLSHRFGPWLLAGLIFASGGIATWSLWSGARREAQQELQSEFQYRARDVMNGLALHMSNYIQVLRGAQGLFAGSDEVTHLEFADFVRAQDVATQFPGMRGIGYMEVVPAAGLASHEARLRAAGFIHYGVRPAGPRERYVPVTYLEPDGGNNRRLLGYDSWSEPVRRAALEQARDSGLPAMSGRLSLLQDDAPDNPGFLIVLPLYRHGQPMGTLEQRRAAVRGFVYAPFVVHELLAGMSGLGGGELDVEVYDGDALDERARISPAAAHPATLMLAERRVSVAGHPWTLAIRALPSFAANLHTDKARAVLATGSAATLLLTLMTWLLARSRAAAALALDNARALTTELEAGQKRLSSLHEASQRAQTMMRSILDSTVDGILVDNGRHRILAANQRFRELWTLPPGLALDGDDGTLLAHMQEQLEHTAAFQYSRSLDYDGSRVHRELLRLKDGRYFEQFTRAVHLGSETARLWSFRDVTERRQVEQRERTHRHVLEMLARGAPMRGILDAVVLGVEAANPGMLCSVQLLDADGQHLRCGAAPSLPRFFNDARDGLPIGDGMGSCGTAAKSGIRVVVDDIAIHPFWESGREVAMRAGVAAAWSEPIRGSAGKILGTFAIYHRAPLYPSPAQVVLMEQSAQLAGIAIEQAQAAEALRAGEERFRSLYDHAPVALWELDWSGVHAASEVLRTRAGADLRGYLRNHLDDARSLAPLVRIVDLNSAALAQAGARHKDLALLSLDQIFGERALEVFIDAVAALQGGALRFTGEGSFTRLDGTRRDNQVTLLVMPGHEKLDFLIVSTLDITERKRLDAELLMLATTDFLTGLPNRRDFMARLEEELARVQRRVDEHAAVLMLDIDHFKTINDRHGHPAGDAVLRHLAQLMRAGQRKIDTLARMGGEEFAVLLPGADSAAAEAYAERLRDAVAAAPCVLEGGMAIAVTVSIGCAAITAADLTGDAALRRADKALYGAKDAGRNRVEGVRPAA